MSFCSNSQVPFHEVQTKLEKVAHIVLVCPADQRNDLGEVKLDLSRIKVSEKAKEDLYKYCM